MVEGGILNLLAEGGGGGLSTDRAGTVNHCPAVYLTYLRHRAPSSCPGWQGEHKSSERASWTGMVPKGLLFLAVVILAFGVSSESHGLVMFGVPSWVHGSQSFLGPRCWQRF